MNLLLISVNVVPYLRGIDTIPKNFAPLVVSDSCTVPKRNWHLLLRRVTRFRISMLSSCTVPKRNWHNLIFHFCSLLCYSCIVPKRNWHCYMFNSCSLSIAVVPYLRGIDACQYPKWKTKVIYLNTRVASYRISKVVMKGLKYL